MRFPNLVNRRRSYWEWRPTGNLVIIRFEIVVVIRTRCSQSNPCTNNQSSPSLYRHSVLWLATSIKRTIYRKRHSALHVVCWFRIYSPGACFEPCLGMTEPFFALICGEGSVNSYSIFMVPKDHLYYAIATYIIEKRQICLLRSIGEWKNGNAWTSSCQWGCPTIPGACICDSVYWRYLGPTIKNRQFCYTNKVKYEPNQDYFLDDKLKFPYLPISFKSHIVCILLRRYIFPIWNALNPASPSSSTNKPTIIWN